MGFSSKPCLQTNHGSYQCNVSTLAMVVPIKVPISPYLIISQVENIRLNNAVKKGLFHPFLKIPIEFLKTATWLPKTPMKKFSNII